jgi:hypothetical protein
MILPILTDMKALRTTPSTQVRNTTPDYAFSNTYSKDSIHSSSDIDRYDALPAQHPPEQKNATPGKILHQDTFSYIYTKYELIYSIPPSSDIDRYERSALFFFWLPEYRPTTAGAGQRY